MDIFTISEVELSDAVVAESQPTHVGFPFVVHVPEQTWNHFKPHLSYLANQKRIRVQSGRPLFCTSDVPMVRIAMNYGDAATAVKVWDKLTQDHKVLAFKNWL